MAACASLSTQPLFIAEFRSWNPKMSARAGGTQIGGRGSKRGRA